MDFDRFDVNAAFMARGSADDRKDGRRIFDTRLCDAIEFVRRKDAIARTRRNERIEEGVYTITGFGVADAMDNNEPKACSPAAPHSSLHRHARLPRDRYTFQS
jgi:hypothetical protein